MALEILTDPRLRRVSWHDLVPLSTPQRTIELMQPLPWLAASLLVAAIGWWPLALPLSFYFYLTGLRLVHDTFHRTLGLPRAVDKIILGVLSTLMLGSMHAVRFNHLEHHRHCLDDDDVEGACARQSAWRALLTGPLFPIRMHWTALRHAPRITRGWIAFELGLNVVLIALAFGVWDVFSLRYHILAMAAGQCLSAFFCVWTVHHDCDRSHFIARTIRNRFRAITTFEMFYHLEHHLFPAVPTRNLPKLAERIDSVAPELQSMRAI